MGSEMCIRDSAGIEISHHLLYLRVFQEAVIHLRQLVRLKGSDGVILLALFRGHILIS